jgi:hypothetical protein
VHHTALIEYVTTSSTPWTMTVHHTALIEYVTTSSTPWTMTVHHTALIEYVTTSSTPWTMTVGGRPLDRASITSMYLSTSCMHVENDEESECMRR